QNGMLGTIAFEVPGDLVGRRECFLEVLVLDRPVNVLLNIESLLPRIRRRSHRSLGVLAHLSIVAVDEVIALEKLVPRRSYFFAGLHRRVGTYDQFAKVVSALLDCLPIITRERRFWMVVSANAELVGCLIRVIGPIDAPA